MKTILVPCDFSKPAVNAFRFALDLAQQSNATIHLLSVIQLPVMHDSTLMPVLNFEQQLLEELHQNAIKEFSSIIEKYNTQNTKVVTHVEFGTIATKIIDCVHNEKIELVVMGSHGATGAREIFVGSNAEKIVRSSPVPVLVVKDYFKGPVTDIVFPNSLDLENQEDLVMHVKALQHFFNARLHILWINTPLNFTSDMVTFERLNAFAKRFMLKNYTIHVFNHADQEEGILHYTKMTNGTMIAMATRGRKGITHLLNGSLAEDVVNHTDKLIWTYKLKSEPIANKEFLFV